MKKLLVLVSLAIVFTFACNNNEVDSLKGENSNLRAKNIEKDSSIYSYISAFNEIQSNLDSIKQKEKIINLTKKGEIQSSSKEQIIEDIKAINDLLERNKNLITILNKKLKKSNKKIGELQKLVAFLNAQVEEKDAQIVSLRNDLEKLKFDITVLNAKNDSVRSVKDTTISNLNTTINTAYYVVGTEKELKLQHIITKEGGFIGIGKMKTLVKDFNKSYFKKIDITKVNKIPVFAKKAEILTNHPSDSYSLDGTDKSVENLVIKNSKDFWSASKYLVVLVK